MKYFMYNLANQKAIEFENLDQLIHYCAGYNHSSWFCKKYCSLFEDLNITGNDTKRQYITATTFELVLRNTMVFDEYDRKVDIRLFAKQILDEQYDLSKLKKSKSKYLFDKKASMYVFREGPVPHIRKGRSHKGASYRRLKYRQQLLTLSSKEHKKFNRTTKNDMGFDFCWYEFPIKSRYGCKSWKNKKVRKQYLKNLK